MAHLPMKVILPCMLLPCLALAGAPGTDTSLAQEPQEIQSQAVETPAIEISIADTSNAAAAPDSARADETDPVPRPVDFSVEYRASYAAFSADISLALQAQQGSDEYRILATTKARGLAKLAQPGTVREEAQFIFEQGEFLSQNYILDTGRKSPDDKTDLRFDHQKQSIASIYEGTPVTLPLTGKIYDRISADIVIMSDLRNGKHPRDLRIAEKNQIRDYSFTLQGEETVEVPAGTYRTVKYLRQRTGSSRSTLIWYAVDAEFVPVRMEQLKRGKSTVTSVATKLTVAQQS
jgi:hypothetical protein